MRARSSAALVALALIACGDGTGPSESVSFTLTEVNGAPPPAVAILWEDGDTTFFESARFELLAFTFRYHEIRVESRNGVRTTFDRLREGTYRRDGSVLWFDMPEGSGDRRYINVDSMDYDGVTIRDWYGSAYLVYTRDDAGE